MDIVRNERGSALIEMGIILPMLAVMITGVVDLSMAYSRKLEIEQGAQRAIEKVMQTTTKDTVHGTLAAEAAAAAKVPVNQVTVKYTIECDGTEKDITANVATYQAAADAKVAAYDKAVADGLAADPDFDVSSVPAIDYSDIDTSNLECTAGTTTQRSYITVNITDSYEPVIDPRWVGIKSDGGKFPITVDTGIRTK